MYYEKRISKRERAKVSSLKTTFNMKIILLIKKYLEHNLSVKILFKNIFINLYCE